MKKNVNFTISTACRELRKAAAEGEVVFRTFSICLVWAEDDPKVKKKTKKENR
jgi:hypothetical protein